MMEHHRRCVGPLLIALAACNGRQNAPAVTPQTEPRSASFNAGDARAIATWRADILFLADTIARGHAAAFHTTSKQQWNIDVASLVAGLPALRRPAILVEIARLVASIGDGHTRFRAYPSSENRGTLRFRIVPIRFESVGSEFVIAATGQSYESLAGARLLGIGTHSTADVVRRLAPLISRDNPFGLRAIATLYMPVAEVLALRGIAESPDSLLLRVETPAGKRISRWVGASISDSLPLRDAFDVVGRTAPWHVRARHDVFWSLELAGGRAAYFQINAIADKPSIRLGDHCIALVKDAARQALHRVVIDLRYNGGGSRELMLPCIDALRASVFNQRGRLFVLVGHRTFSAALWAALDFSRTTEAILIGEPTSGRPNFYGETRWIETPDLSLHASFASRMNLRSDTGDKRVALVPRVVVVPRWTDFINARDPALDAALAWRP